MLKMILMMIMIMTMTTVCFLNNATCQSGFAKKGYRCLCTAGFEGLICERGIHNFNVDGLKPSV